VNGLLIGLLAAAAAPGPSLPVGGSLMRADGAVVEQRTVTVDPVRAPDVRSLRLSVDGRRVVGGPPWRLATREYGDGPHRVEVTATDAAGRATTETAEVRFARADPLPPDAPAGTTLLRGARPGDALGSAVANVGDVDGDGIEDVLAGAPGARTAYLVLRGRVLRFRGDAGTGRAVAAGGDVNGDGYRDLVIGSARRTYVAFGGPALRSLDLRRLGGRGLTIPAAGALASRRLGDFAVDGDVDGDGLDDVAIGEGETTAVALGRRSAGLAPVTYRIQGAGRSIAFPGDVNHDGRADLLAVGDGGADVVYGGGGGFRVRGDVTSAGTVGDVDGDSTPDLLLGGPSASYVVFAQPGGDIDLRGDFPGFRIDAPPGAGPATVMGTGDLDGDYAPDVAVGLRGAAYVVFSPLEQKVVSLAELPGELGARIGSGPAVDGLDAFGAGVPAAIAGDPRGAGRVAVVSGFAGADATGCLPNALWSFPLSAGHVLPRCRRASRLVDSPAFNPSPDAGQIGRFNPAPACGAPSRTCQPTAYRSGNARIHGPGVGLATDAIVDLVDSYGARLAAIQRAGPACFTVFDRDLTRVGATCDPTGDPPVPHPMEVQVQGRACMATDALEQSHYLARLLDPSGPPAGAYRELQGFVRRDQLALGSEQTTVGGATYSPQELAEAAYSGCGPAPPKRRAVPIPFIALPGLPSGDRLFGFDDRYVSNASFADCEGHAPPPDLRPGCYGPYANYQVPTLAAKDPQVATGDPRARADWAALTVSSTGVSGSGYPAHPQDGQDVDAAGGGLVRAIVPRRRPFTALDGFAYADPNVPCDMPRVARWAYGFAVPRRGERAIYGWTPFREPQGVRERNGLSPACP
jgi:hypothetical protein